MIGGSKISKPKCWWNMSATNQRLVGALNHRICNLSLGPIASLGRLWNTFMTKKTCQKPTGEIFWICPWKTLVFSACSKDLLCNFDRWMSATSGCDHYPTSPELLQLLCNCHFLEAERSHCDCKLCGTRAFKKLNTVKPVLSGHSKWRPKIGFQDRLSLNAGQKYCRMLQESILQYFRPSISYHMSLRPLFCQFLSGHLRQAHFLTVIKLGDSCIQNFHLGRYIDGYTVGNLGLRRRTSGAVKRDFQTYIWPYTSPNENFEYGFPHYNALLQFDLKLEPC